MSFIIAITLLVSSLYLINQYFFNYWKKRNFAYAEPSFLIGNLGKMLSMKVSFNEFMADLYKKHKNKKYFGIYFSYRPALVVNDPEIIQQIIIKEFQSFHDRPMPINEENDPIAQNLFFLKGKKWRDLRVKLTPIFTSNKLKAMFPILNDCGNVLIAYIDENLRKRNNVLDFKDLLSRLTTNIISSVAFGVESDCINDRENYFRKIGTSIFTGSIKRAFLNFMTILLPNVMIKLKMKFATKELEDFFLSLVTETIEYREKNNIVRNDFMQLMIQLKNQGYVTADKDDTKVENENEQITKLTLDDIVAQTFVFFSAGFETSSSTMAFTLYELCKNQEILRKVQKEIDAKMNGEKELTYDMINDMKYLDCCIDETLRKYPLVPIFRVTTKDFKIPEYDDIVEAGTPIHIPILGLHRDPEIFENPLEYKPERFLDSPNGNGKAKGLFYFPFGDGPRSCIGARMGKLQAKLGLAVLLRQYNFEFNDKNLYNGEIEFDPKQLSMSMKKNLELKVSAREN
ncbi:hypothetical protein PVAND_012305 [Polypedilum vanderplanki]|uniref:Cytochrome P450 n=1 Tax=Polypedilum vanderplanki TaxID=319348 RepID=A0A9J6CL66_POLVA|nr:hypothetical protein PVAND_012305 [Polypedilum vanderplanki]